MSVSLEDFSLETSNKMTFRLTTLSGFVLCGLKTRSWNEILIRQLANLCQTDIQGGSFQKV